MSRKEKTIWITMHVVCICVLIVCIMKNKELFPGEAAAAANNMGNVNLAAGTAAGEIPDKIEGINNNPTDNPKDNSNPAAGSEESGDINNPAAKTENLENASNQTTESGNSGDGLNGTTEPGNSGDGSDPAIKSENPGDSGEADTEPEKSASILDPIIDPDSSGTEGEQNQQGEPTPAPSLAEIGDLSVYDELANINYSWWFRRKKDHVPSGSGEEFPIAGYQAFFRNLEVEEGDKVIYLTFDCGYENGNSPKVLDTLKKHNAQAMFFVTKAYLKKCPENVIRMKEEGHLVGNHTMNHPVMPEETVEKLIREILDCAELMKEVTGYEMDKFLRPPTGAYSQRTLQLTKDLGYTTIFWSIAYKDYDENDQPGKDYVINHYTTYHHNGAIPLIHITSKSNMEALDTVLTMLEEEGYRFGSLYELLD